MSQTKAKAPRVVTADDLCAEAMYRVLAKGSSHFVGKPLPKEWGVPQSTVLELKEEFEQRFPHTVACLKTSKRGGADD